MTVLVVSGTGTGVGKTVVMAAIAALARSAGQRVSLLKPAQSGVAPGEPGDVDAAGELSGVRDRHELARYPDPLAPATAARRAGLAEASCAQAVDIARRLSADHDLVLIEGAGGVLVRYDSAGATIADVAAALDAAVVVVAPAGLGALNATGLTLEAIRARGLGCAGVVIGAWPSTPDLAACSNIDDVETYAGAPLVGALPEHAGELDPGDFLRIARRSLGPELGGEWDRYAFRAAATRQTGTS